MTDRMLQFVTWRDRLMRWSRPLLHAEDALPVALVGGIAIGSFVWNAYAGLTWTPALPVFTLLLTTFAFFGIVAIFSTVFSNRVMVELATYYGLWASFPFFGVRLNYLAATLDFPLQDALFARADQAIGFDWLTWASIAWSHPTFINVLIVAYRSNIYQPLLLVVLFAVWGPRGRNRELLTATIFACLITVAISAVLPSFGPNRAYGIHSEWDSVLLALRAGTHLPLHYVGIVTFPSFHASMAVLFAAAMRGNVYRFAAASLVNGLMLIATVPIGYHYLVDLIAGCVIAVGALYAARLTDRRRDVFGHSLNAVANARPLKPPIPDRS